MAAKIFRINYKSDFILTLNSDAGWMTPFCIKFWTGAPSQAYFVGWDGTTYTHCSYDPSEPTKLLVQFDDHHLPIGDLKFQIAYHFTVADFPEDTEDEVINPASITVEIDGERYQVMLDFTGETAPEIAFSLPAYANEAQRIANEQQRIANEDQRIANEQTRIDNEALRISAEQTRQDNEAQRIRNEQTRINQEEARVREFATLKNESEAATTAANNAAALANQKAQLAADKAQLAADKAALAQDAANLANQKAQLAADKAALAQDAADLANQKAQLAQQKAEYAQTQGDYAKEQGDYAKRKGDDAATQMQQQAQEFSEAQAARQTAYQQAEGTESGSVAGDGSRWGAFKTNEAARDAKVDAKVADITNLQEAVAEGAVYDVSAQNPTAGPNNDGKWGSLSALLSDANLNTLIPTSVRRGGMSIKFVCSSDNKYVQYMYNNTSTVVADFINVDNWEKINIEKEVSNLQKEVFALETPSITVEQGTLSSTTGSTDTSSIRIRTAGYLIAEAIRITTSGNKAKLVGYTDNNSYVGCTDFYTENTEARIPRATKYKIIFGKSDNSSITPEDFNTLGINISLILDTGVVRTDSQYFTDAEKEVVRNNINAASKNDTLLIKQEASQVAANYTGWDEGYVDSDGRLIKISGSRKVSGKILIIPDTPIIVNRLKCNASFSTLAAFDENDNYIAECSICQGTDILTQTTIQTTGKKVSYIRITAITGAAPSVTATIPVIDKTVVQAVTELIGKKYVLADAQELSDTDKLQARENIGAASEEDITFNTTEEVNPATAAKIATWDYGYIKPDGSIQTASSGSYKYSDKIPIVPDSAIIVRSMYCNTTVTSLAAYDNNNALIPECSISQRSSIAPSNPVTIDTSGYNVAYIRITWGGGYDGFNITITQITGEKSIKQKVSDIEQDISDIEQEMSNIGIGVQWDGKSWVALGTSITDTNNTLAPDGTATGKFVPKLVELSGLSVHNYGVAGAVIGGHILYYATHPGSYSNALLVTIEGGVNDWAASKPLGQVGDTIPYLVTWSSPVWDNGGNDETGTFAGAVYQTLLGVMQNYPNAQIVVITDNTGKSVPSTGANCSREVTNSLGLTQYDYTNMLIDVAHYMGVPVINAGQRSMINQDNPDYLIDQIHHTELGGEQYANVIWSELKNIPNRAIETT